MALLTSISAAILPNQLLLDSPKPAAVPGIGHFSTSHKTEETQAIPHHFNNIISLSTTKRASIALGIALLVGHSGCSDSLAEVGNGLWRTGPIPVPTVDNKIANEKTGTRSFLKKGIYIANIGADGSQYRIRKYAFDLLGLGDLIGKDSWNYMRKYLRIKSTIMYYDFDKVISAAPIEEKQPLTDLANRLFDNVEKLENVIKMQSEPETIACYEDTTTLLKEVMTRMA